MARSLVTPEGVDLQVKLGEAGSRAAAVDMIVHKFGRTTGYTAGRVTNKGMEGLAITPDGKMLVGAMQSALIQDGGDVKGGVTRIITIDIKSGETHEYAYQLDQNTKTTISDIVAINNHEFLVDERDSKGRADAVGSKASFKKLFIVDLQFAHDVSGITGFTGPASAPVANIAPFAVTKTEFLDVVKALTSAPANDSASNGWHTRPTPGRTSSGGALSSATTIGVPQANDSSSTMPNPSMSLPTCRLGRANRSHCW